MVQLDYRTNNSRWGLRGVRFDTWQSYSFALGYFSNRRHYYNLFPLADDAKISIHIEGNNEQGAWEKEGRIHYYGTKKSLEDTFADLYNCSSAGTGKITKRINSNNYILSLINDYDFQVKTYAGYTTADIFPPDAEVVKNHLRRHLMNVRLTNTQIDDCVNSFMEGYNL